MPNTSPIPNPARFRPVRLLLACGVLLAAAMTAGTGLILSNLRERALDDSERALQSVALILAEQTDRAFQAIDVAQASLIERMQALGIASADEYERKMSAHDVHLLLKERLSGLPYVDEITLINAQGMPINSSGSWPIPAVSVADRDYFKALRSDPQSVSFVSKPVRDSDSGTWTIHLARKFVGSNGELVGFVLGAMELRYLEQFFGTPVVGEEGSISLFRRDGELLIRYPQRDSRVGTFASGELFTRVLSRADRGVMRLTSVVDGKERIVAGQGLAHYPIVVGVATTVKAALAGWQSAAIYMVGAAVLLIFVIGTTILLGIRQIRSYELLVQARAENAQKAQLDAALNNMRQGLQMYDAKGRVVLTNQKYLRMYGLPADAEKPGWTIRDVLYLRKAAGTLAGEPDSYLVKMIDHGKVDTKVVELPDGRTMSVTNAPVPDGGWVSTHEDITESKRREASFRLLFEGNPLPMWVYEVDTLRFLAVNDAAVAHYGFSREQFLAMTVADIRPVEDRERLMEFVRSAPGTQQGNQIWRHRKADGTEIEVAIHSRALRYEGRTAVLAAARDVTEQRRAELERARSEQRIVHLAHHDALTDLPNRVLFREQLDKTLARVFRGERIAVLYLDLDNFKHVNDTLGHSMGDELLKAVADRLRGCVREVDSIARLGGDEFAIIQASLKHPTEAAVLAGRIRETLKAPYLLDGHEIVVQVSIGIAIAPNDARERDELLKNADMALYGAKAAGRDAYRFFEPAMNERVKARHDLGRDLRRALANNEFELHYQPVVDLQADALSGFEALLRWRHPARGLISPSEFIPVAEETGLIASIGEWVLRTVCAEAASWPDHVKVAVNLSPNQLRSSNLLPVVINAISASGLPARRLDLEITESVLMHNTAATLETLHQLRELGVRIALDDFGMGYSSLSYLLSFPFDKIKIDRSFIKGLPDTDNSVAIVRAVTSLARSLDMTTTAEGVETEQQLDMLKALGCTEIQGYIFSPARPAAEVSRLFLSPHETVANVA